MERVIFRIEETGQSVSCLLNPETLELRRASGVRYHPTAGGIVAGSEQADDPLLFTGGGRTELTLDLLFDVALTGAEELPGDVRRLTGPLWRLAENARRGDGHWRPARVHLFWGKERAMLGVISAIAERLDYFSASGVPQRSWLRMRMLRVADDPGAAPNDALPLPDIEPGDALNPARTDSAVDSTGMAATIATAVQSDGSGGGDRLDQLAWRFYGDASAWRLLAWLNDVDDPLRLGTGSELRIASGAEGAR